MITYTSENNFRLINKDELASWVEFAIHQECMELGEINYIFCNDDYLHNINVNTLKHNTLTDIISFDYTTGILISGDIYISIDRVKDNAHGIGIVFKDELHRVMIHGILHYCGYNDKLNEDKQLMRSKEDYYLSLRTF